MRGETRFTLHDLGAFPGLVEGGTHAVLGEVYLVGRDSLARLDRLEGHPTFYRRIPVDRRGRDHRRNVCAAPRAGGVLSGDRIRQLAGPPKEDDAMEIVMRDGRVFKGTPVEIVRDMKEIGFGVEHLSLSEYIDWVAANAKKFEEVELRIAGETEEEKAASLVAEMIRTGLTREA